MDPATKRRAGIAANAVGLLLLLVFIVFGPSVFDDSVVAWGTFLVGVVLTALGIALLKLSGET